MTTLPQHRERGVEIFAKIKEKNGANRDKAILIAEMRHKTFIRVVRRLCVCSTLRQPSYSHDDGSGNARLNQICKKKKKISVYTDLNVRG
ncbi:hypothetical protein F2P81_005242 [Scophthalmus maximus]|uniref:Uncharacterized protein n=1 Tax=Scophthalmus maximus TaxID=52904 RepID=A0A6A4TD22_SCOMX|nr:hypothetical protein F2P81_005242 [Scophthalmus maximus]